MRNTSNQKKLIKIITMPIRVLRKGKDMYEKSMMDVAQKPIYGSKKKMGSMKKGQAISGNGGGGGLSKSLSTSVITRSSSYENHENMIELIRSNSTSTMELIDMELYLKQLIKEEQMNKVKELMNKNNLGKSKSLKRVSRSCSVGMGRIDEDKALEFIVEEKEDEEEMSRVIGGKKIKGLYSRSRTNAIIS